MNGTFSFQFINIDISNYINAVENIAFNTQAFAQSYINTALLSTSFPIEGEGFYKTQSVSFDNKGATVTVTSEVAKGSFIAPDNFFNFYGSVGGLFLDYEVSSAVDPSNTYENLSWQSGNYGVSYNYSTDGTVHVHYYSANTQFGGHVNSVVSISSTGSVNLATYSYVYEIPSIPK